MKFSTVFVPALLAITTYAAPVAVALPEAQAVAEADSLTDLLALSGKLASVNSDIFQLTSTLGSNELPTDILSNITSTVLTFLEGAVSAITSGEASTEITSVINNLATEATTALDDIAASSDLDPTTVSTLTTVISNVKGLLTNISSTILSALQTLLSFNLGSLVTGLINTALAALKSILSTLKSV